MHAFLSGLLAGSALLLGAIGGYYFHFKTKTVALVMSFGAGVLISVISIELMQDAYDKAGILGTGAGFFFGGALYTYANSLLQKRGAVHRKRSGGQQKSEEEHAGSGSAIAVGALLDGIPESIVLGLGLVTGSKLNLVTFVAIFISNIPEGLSSSAGMKKANRPAAFIFGMWIVIMIISGLASWAGFALFRDYSPLVVGSTTAVAAGAILTMLVDTMIPEAYEDAYTTSGLVTLLGFLLSFWLSQVS